MDGSGHIPNSQVRKTHDPILVEHLLRCNFRLQRTVHLALPILMSAGH